jgi:hypothetical protein
MRAVINTLLGPFVSQPAHLTVQLVVSAGMAAALLLWAGWPWLGEVRPIKRLAAVSPQLKVRLQRAAMSLLTLTAILTSVSYFYGSRNNGTWIQRWDLYHTVMTVKYDKELSYFDLYNCTVEFGRGLSPKLRTIPKMRDLRSSQLVPTETSLATSECKERFTPARRDAFVEDLAFFCRWDLPWWRMLKDKGYNGTPHYTLVTGTLFKNIDLSYANLVAVGLIDVALVGIAFASILWGFGRRTALLSIIFFCTNFPGRFAHMGGSVLRFDYIAGLMICAAAIKRERYGLVGFLLAWATLVRGFPALFGAGLLVVLAWEFAAHRRVPAGAPRLVGAGLLSLLVLFGATVAFGGGLEAWQAWMDNMAIHTRNTASYRIGLKHLFMAWPQVVEGQGLVLPSFNIPDTERLKWAYWATGLALLIPLLTSLRRIDRLTAFVFFGLIALFVGLVATRYYYSVLVLPFLAGPTARESRGYPFVLAALFGMSAIGNAVYQWFPDAPASIPYNYVFSGLVLLFSVGSVAWLLGLSCCRKHQQHRERTGRGSGPGQMI